ncbi:hypothetical protein KAFR_0J00840 [Kazachstania africana CBS 2517]|uniref:lysine--tRNA ligase n=1 Tax=Kazachstania africana (strain ATCC 22294 / BCRC 22015 / CBS 2517 / CECT 1963 / NBRC 1671 / NRRL Y-8276) TaxID=1071382 RepID=H2B0K2_KAZAF|nr:hypothetical protein KAFR_0J00840 [Kazachstania africana CBS 2517]CCF60152.1 hypothetical protein KAFR_0J00840 [Kazachstania africana CBS 2517]
MLWRTAGATSKAPVCRLLGKWKFARYYAVDTRKLEYAGRNEQIEKDLDYYYPSMSVLRGNHQGKAQSITVEQFNAQFQDREEFDRYGSVLYTMNGRIKNIRFSGKKICFIDLQANNDNRLRPSAVQLIVNFNALDPKLTVEDYVAGTTFLRKNDYIQVQGFAGVSSSSTHQLSLRCTKIPSILSPVKLPLPSKLVSTSKIHKNRVIDYQLNGTQILILRSQVIKSIREFLYSQGFLEVETPILSSKSSGANATPFVTKTKDNVPLELRVAPELWLKRLTISGLNKIFEIAKVFRNEGIDAVHNSEFTMLEFYQTYASMDDLITMSENLFKSVLLDLQKLIKEQGNEINDQISSNIDTLVFNLQESNWKFKRIEFLPTLSNELHTDLNKIDLDEPSEILKAIPEDVKHHLFSQNEALSPHRVLDKLCSHYIEQKYCNTPHPTLIYHHPLPLSPLAKRNPLNPRTVKRFELFINSKEYVNAYEEENCPHLQMENFVNQQNHKDSSTIDFQYVESMKYGMPPTGGLGLGIDRLCMLLLGKPRIEDVLPFGTIDDVNTQ